MIEELKKKTKQKGRRYADKLFGPFSSELLAGTSPSVSIGDSGAMNTPVPSSGLPGSILEPKALTPPGLSPQVAPISASPPDVVSRISPSTDAHPPLSPTNSSYVLTAQDPAPIQGSLRAANNPSIAERSGKHIAWSGLKTLMEILNNSADAFPPLKSAIGGILTFVKVYDVCTRAILRYQLRL